VGLGLEFLAAVATRPQQGMRLPPYNASLILLVGVGVLAIAACMPPKASFTRNLFIEVEGRSPGDLAAIRGAPLLVAA